MKFVIDEQLPPALCDWLRQRGHQADHIFSVGLGGCSDQAIVDYVIANNATLLSKDDDFVVLRLTKPFTFVWVRIGNATTNNLFAWLDPRWERLEKSLNDGDEFVELL